MSTITFRLTDSGTHAICDKTLDLDPTSVCPIPDPPLWTFPAVFDTRGADPNANLWEFPALPSNRVCLTSRVAGKIWDIWDYTLDPPTLVLSAAYTADSLMEAGIYQADTSKIVAFIGTSPYLPGNFAISFFDLLGNTLATVPIVIGGTTTFIPMQIRNTHKVAFFLNPNPPATGNLPVFIYVCDCDTYSVQTIQINPVDAEESLYCTYCCVSDEFAVTSWRNIGGGFHETYLKMIDAGVGTETARYTLTTDTLNPFPIYCDSTEQVIIQEADKWRIFDPLTGLTTGTQPFGANDVFFFPYYDFFLDAVITPEYDHASSHYLLVRHNPIDMSVLGTIDPNIKFQNFSASPDDGTLFCQIAPTIGTNFVCQVRPVIL